MSSVCWLDHNLSDQIHLPCNLLFLGDGDDIILSNKFCGRCSGSDHHYCDQAIRPRRWKLKCELTFHWTCQAKNPNHDFYHPSKMQLFHGNHTFALNNLVIPFWVQTFSSASYWSNFKSRCIYRLLNQCCKLARPPVAASLFFAQFVEVTFNFIE